MKKSSSFPASLGGLKSFAGMMPSAEDTQDDQDNNISPSSEFKHRSALMQWINKLLGGVSGEEPKLGSNSGLSPVKKWAKGDLRDRFRTGLIEKPWAKIADSRLFSFKPKFAIDEPEPRRPNGGDAAVPNAFPKSLRTHGRSKSEIVERDEDRLRRDLLLLTSNEFESIPLRPGAHRTVTGVFRESRAFDIHARSAEMEVEWQPLRAVPEGGGPAGIEEPTPFKVEADCETNHTADCVSCLQDLDHDIDISCNSRNSPAASSEHVEDVLSSDRETEPDNPESTSQKDKEPAYLDPSKAARTLVNTALQSGVWGLNQSALVNPYLRPQITKVPDCTASDETKYWRVTDSMLKAYTAMRGPYRAAGRDLFVWMDRCSKTYCRPEECNELVGSCEEVIDGIEPLYAEYPPPHDAKDRKDCFLVPRPPFAHIIPHSGFKFSDHDEPDTRVPTGHFRQLQQEISESRDFGCENSLEEMVSCNDPEPTYEKTRAPEDWSDFYISDDEGDPHEGRISPCTFRLWAEGCERWDSSQIEAAQLAQPYYPCMAESMNYQPSWDFEYERNNDESDISMAGLGDVSDEYLPSDDPYMMCNKPGQESPIRLTEWNNFRIDHPGTTKLQGFRKARIEEWVTGEETVGDHAESSDSDDSKTFTDTEVLAALQAKGARLIAGVAPLNVEKELQERRKRLEEAIKSKEGASEDIAAAEYRLSLRRAQAERMAASITTLLNKDNIKIERRRKAIYRHVSQHLREVEEKTKLEDRDFQQMADRLADLQKEEQELAERIVMASRRVGVTSDEPDEAEKELEQLIAVHERGISEEDNSFF
ncbi:Fc.00g018050.m01.CDS01 [Cosmosporella sp. VM-42]